MTIVSYLPVGLQAGRVHRRRRGSSIPSSLGLRLLTRRTGTAHEHDSGAEAPSRVPPHGEFRHEAVLALALAEVLTLAFQ